MFCNPSSGVLFIGMACSILSPLLAVIAIKLQVSDASSGLNGNTALTVTEVTAGSSIFAEEKFENENKMI